jgi:hypothetical protein
VPPLCRRPLPHGVVWSIDTTNPDFPEIGTVTLHDRPTFTVWRATDDLRLLHVLDMRCCIIQQSLPLAQIGTQSRDLGLGAGAQ